MAGVFGSKPEPQRQPDTQQDRSDSYKTPSKVEKKPQQQVNIVYDSDISDTLKADFDRHLTSYGKDEPPTILAVFTSTDRPEQSRIDRLFSSFGRPPPRDVILAVFRYCDNDASLSQWELPPQSYSWASVKGKEAVLTFFFTRRAEDRNSFVLTSQSERNKMSLGRLERLLTQE